MSIFYDLYNSFLNEETTDPRVKNWPFIEGTWKIFTIIIVYLLSTYVIFPLFMRNRKPFNLRSVIIFYNIYQIIACSIVVYGVSTSGWTTYYSMTDCEQLDASESEIAVRMTRYVWWHMILKFTDLIETIFFILRKKFNQVTFLHVYHHAYVVFLGWYIARYVPGGMFTFTIAINSTVHIFMYSYYLLASLGPEMQKKLNVIKSKLTLIQIIQLSIILMHSLLSLTPNCQLPTAGKWIYAIHIPGIATMIILFLKFYISSYRNKNKKHI